MQILLNFGIRASGAKTKAPTLAFVSKTQTSITLSITNNDKAPLTDIEIRYNSTSFTQGSLSITSNTSENFEITGLEIDTEFNFIATADANGKGFSKDSNTITESTLINQAPDVTFVSRTHNSLTYGFKNKNGVSANIKALINSGTGAPPNVTTSTETIISNLGAGLTLNHTFTGLTQNTNYRVGARAEINNNLSGQTDSAAVATIGYNISLSPTSVNEGQSTTASITTQNFPSGTLF
jgi:hypothetical protein